MQGQAQLLASALNQPVAQPTKQGAPALKQGADQSEKKQVVSGASESSKKLDSGIPVEAGKTTNKASLMLAAGTQPTVAQASSSLSQVLAKQQASQKNQISMMNKSDIAAEFDGTLAKGAPQITVADAGIAGTDPRLMAAESADMSASTSKMAAQVAALDAVLGNADVHSFEYKPEVDAKTPTSKLSTNDFLNLREMSQNLNPAMKQVIMKDAVSTGQGFPEPGKAALTAGLAEGLKNKGELKKMKSEISGSAMMNLNHAPQAQMGFAKVIDAQVAQGPQQKPVLTHDALTQISQQVNMMSMAKQDGEIKIRLRPDHLGEMHMSVRTEGQQVSIQIQAHNGESKKIIEDSLSALKDNLLQQNLTLSKVDVVVAPHSPSGSNDAGMQPDMSSSRQNHDQSGQQFSNQGSGRESRQDRLFEEEGRRSNMSVGRNPSFMSAKATNNTQGLDLIAS